MEPYSRVKIQPKIKFDEEHQILLEEQKANRAMARKLTLETNRRRRALEEKCRENAEKEKKFREEVLQERKLRQQNATERFQRAHLPPSQRKQNHTVYRKSIPYLEEALEQIQGSFYSSQLSSLARNTISNRTADSSPNLSTPRESRNSSRYKKQLLETMSYATLVREQSGINLNIGRTRFHQELEETQRLLEEQQLSSLQKFQQKVHQISKPESLSSLDSLETGGQELVHTKPHVSITFKAENDKSSNIIRPHPPINNLFDSVSNNVNDVLKKEYVNAWIGHLVGQNVCTERTETKNVKDGRKIHEIHLQTDTTASSTNDYLFFTSNKTIDLSSKIEENIILSDKDNFRGGSDIKAANHGSVPPQVTCNSCKSHCENDVVEEKAIELAPSTSLTTKSLKASKNETKNCIYEKNNLKRLKGILKKVSKYDNFLCKSRVTTTGVFGIQLASSVRDSVELAKMKEKESEPHLTKKKLRWFDEIEQTNQLKGGKLEEMESTGQIKKSELNYQTQLQSPSSQMNGFIASENPIVNNKEAKRNTPRSDYKTATNSNLLGHQESQFQTPVTVTALKISDTASVNQGVASFVSTGYHFTKPAWAATGVRGTNSNHSKPEKPSVPKRRTKVVCGARSAKAQIGTGATYRKGTMIHPQSVTKASKIFMFDGKIIIPHPPPKPAINKKQFQNPVATFSSGGQSQINPAGFPANTIDIYSSAMKRDMPEEHNNRGSAVVSDLWSQGEPSSAIRTFTPPCSISPGENCAKAQYLVNPNQALDQQINLRNCTRRSPVYGENGLRLDHTPTDEEITQLWNGVRCALTQRDSASGDCGNYVASCNNSHTINLQPSQMIVPHVTIDGGSLFNKVRSASRMRGFFSAPSSAATRRKYYTESANNDFKHRDFFEQRRLIPAREPVLKRQNSVRNFQINPYPSTFEPVQAANSVQNSEEVSESTAQFMLAENLVKMHTPDNDILAAMEKIQTQRRAFLQHKVQHFGLSALSFEEQKLLQSLDRLNQRLQYVQETFGSNPSTGLLQISSPFTVQTGISGQASRPGQEVTSTQRPQSLSADNHVRIQRRALGYLMSI
ncbi:centrosomal protein of 126 kDa [Callorhinchus milii]|uniref:centrosomal protein of 126 kDa n=1 Tax=Callorhinchus milii TaxID=7868 RepID=UPI001C3FF305|nr:centrosomal protein of 126 kDa [Callorhinchus milii]